MKHTWRDVEAIALDLLEHHPDTDPLSMSLGELRDLVRALPRFGDDPAAAGDEVLEAIQQAWYEEYED